MSDDLSRLAIRRDAEARCEHPDQWVSVTEPGYTAKACWDCLLDAYFDARMAESPMPNDQCRDRQYEAKAPDGRPPNPPSPVCHLGPDHDGPHEGRTAAHQRLVTWPQREEAR